MADSDSEYLDLVETKTRYEALLAKNGYRNTDPKVCLNCKHLGGSTHDGWRCTLALSQITDRWHHTYISELGTCKKYERPIRPTDSVAR